MSPVLFVYVMLSEMFLKSVWSFKGFESIESCMDPTSMNGGPLATVEIYTHTACATLCSGTAPCRAFTFRGSHRSCFLHAKYIPFTPCSVDTDLHYNDMYNPCQHGGNYNPGSDICQCFGGYLGNRCERLMTDCSDGESYYNGQQGNYLAQPSLAPSPFTVHCDMQWGGRTAVLVRRNGNENFNRPWADYKRGFGTTSGDFWLGNDFIHYISASRKHSLLVQIETATTYRQYFYQDFRVSDEESKYRVSFGLHFSHDQTAHGLGDCLGPLANSKFSTPDQDNDGSTRHCAQDFQSGWWFKDCSACNPTGRYELSPPGGLVSGAEAELHWTPVLGNESPRVMLLYLVYGDPDTW